MTLFDPLRHGEGFNGFRNAIDLVTRDIAYGGVSEISYVGGTPEHAAMMKRYDQIRSAVSHRFERDIREHADRRRPGVYRSIEWTAYTDRDFDTTAYRVTHQMAHKDNTPVLAYANWNEGRIELREDSAHLVGSTYRLLLALVGSPSTRYSSSARADVTTWSPFVTDEAMLCLHGSMYSGSGDMKSVQVKKEAAAFDALKRLVARHFKVDFTNVDPTAQAA